MKKGFNSFSAETLLGFAFHLPLAKKNNQNLEALSKSIPIFIPSPYLQKSSFSTKKICYIHRNSS